MKITVEFDNISEMQAFVKYQAKEPSPAPLLTPVTPMQKTPIRNCEAISVRVENALIHAGGLQYMEDAIALSDYQLRKITHIGPKALNEIRTWQNRKI